MTLNTRSEASKCIKYQVSYFAQALRCGTDLEGIKKDLEGFWERFEKGVIPTALSEAEEEALYSALEYATDQIGWEYTSDIDRRNIAMQFKHATNVLPGRHPYFKTMQTFFASLFDHLNGDVLESSSRTERKVAIAK